MKVKELFKKWRLRSSQSVKFSVYIYYEETLLWEGTSIEYMPKEIGDMNVTEWANDESQRNISTLWCFAKKKVTKEK